jgi:ABC-type amino acid transport substrate-binding protein
MKDLKHRFVKLLIMTLFLCLNVLAHAKQESEKPIKIAVNKTSFPYHFQNQQGDADGIMVDYWKLWAQKQDVDIEFVIMDWLQTLSSVSKNETDIHTGMVKTEAREEIFTFTPNFFNQKSHIYIHRDYGHIENIEQLMPLTIGVVDGSSHVEQIKKLHPQFKLKKYKNRFALFDGPLKGEVAAFSNLDRLFRNYTRRKELLIQFPTYRRMFFKQEEYTSAVAKDNTLMSAFIEQGLAKISSEEKSSIEKKWLGFDKSADKLSLAYTPNLLPYMGVSPQGKAQGLFVDIWRLWSKQTGLAIEFIPQKMSDAVDLIKEGVIDAHIAYPNNQLSIDNLTLAKQVYGVPSNVYISSKIPNIKELSQLNGKRMGYLIQRPKKKKY